MLALLVNGVECANPASAIAAGDRGLSYGDGLFETMSLQRGKVRFLESHLARLSLGCERLGIRNTDERALRAEIAQISASIDAGVLKIVVTRGAGTRGYRASAGSSPTRIVSLHEPASAGNFSIRVRWCETRLSRNPVLAGIKHLNRLEQVLAQNEWSDAAIEEGFMLDGEGELVSATAANVFVVRDRELVTSDLRYCGVRGVMRGEVIRLANQLGVSVHEEPLWPEDLDTASEVFVTNAIRGIRAVATLDHYAWPPGPVTQALSSALAADA